MTLLDNETAATIQKDKTYTTVEAGENYTVLEPDKTRYSVIAVENGVESLKDEVFLGWDVTDSSGTVHRIQPKESINLADYGKTVTLTAQWELQPSEKKLVTYNINLPSEITPLNTEDAPSILNASTYQTYLADKSIILSPGSQSYYGTDSSGNPVMVTFKGWAVNGDTTDLLEPGSEITIDQYDSDISLDAQWEYTVLENAKIITYNINLEHTPVEQYAAPTIMNKTTWKTIATGDTYTLLAPSSTQYQFNYGSTKYLGESTFSGWTVNSGSEVGAGQELTLSNYSGTNITLTAKWVDKIGGTNEPTSVMVNYYVLLKGVPEGADSFAGGTDENEYTDSVYTSNCGVTGGGYIYDDLIIAGANITSDNCENLDTYDKNVRKLGDENGFSKTISGTTYTFKASFPSDEEVLKRIRDMYDTLISKGKPITVNGVTVAKEDLNTENFRIKWNVFKYSSGDSWHIDGILVTKSGKAKVQKTFAGDSATIANIKSGNYSIAVTEDSGQSGGAHTSSTLTIATSNEVSADSTYSGNTYTWDVDVDQYYDYTLQEKNYAASDPTTTTTVLYNVRNSKTASQNTSGWNNYSSSVSFTGRSYDSEEDCLTVSLMNTYTLAGTVVLQKVDADTGELIPNVSFTIGKLNDSSFNGVYLYNNGSTVGYYTSDPDKKASATPTTTITTDDTGQAYLYIGSGVYTFKEDVPDGYEDPGIITANLAGSSVNEYKVVRINSVSAANSSLNNREYVSVSSSDTSGLTMQVLNYSSRQVSVRVKKNWKDNQNQQVVLQLYRNGVSMGENYRMTFDGTVDSKETVAWTQTFTNLPLYVNGELANYTVREEQIGEDGFIYSDEYDDGYLYFDVRYSDPVYYDSTGAVTTDKSNASEVELNVINQKTADNTVNLVVSKTVTDSDGNAVSDDEEFSFRVTSDKAMSEGKGYVLTKDGMTATFQLKSGETVTLNDVVKGSNLTVLEAGAKSYTTTMSLITGTTPSPLETTDTDEGKSSEVSIPEAMQASSAEIKVVNQKPPGKTLKIVKTKRDGTTALSGVSFDLYSVTQSFDTYGKTVELLTKKNDAEYVSDENGIVLEETELSAGTYLLRETSAPEGYYKNGDIRFVVSEDGVTITEGEDAVGGTVTCMQDSSTGVYTLTVPDKAYVDEDINFYLNLESAILDTEGNVLSRQSSSFTTSVTGSSSGLNTGYKMRTSREHDHSSSEETWPYSLVAGDDTKNAKKSDEEIRSMEGGFSKNGDWYQIVDSSGNGAFPTDEAVFQYIRDNWNTGYNVNKNKNQYLKVNGTAVDKDNLTTENFVIRWYVMKDEKSDAWHVDGIIVPKAGTLKVTKTFDSKAEAAAFAENFYIRISGKSLTEDNAVVIAVLKSSSKNELPYDSEIVNNNGTVTYTWNLAVYGDSYQISEFEYDDTGPWVYQNTSWTYTPDPETGNAAESGSGETGIVNKNGYTAAVDVYYRDEYIPSQTLDVTNHYEQKVYALPQSGSIGTYLFTISGVAIFASTLLLFIKCKRKEEKIRLSG